MSSTNAQLSAVRKDRPKTAQKRENKEAVNTDTLHALNNSAKLLHKEYAQLKMESSKRFEEMQYVMKQVKWACLV